MNTAYLLFGSNEGDREHWLRTAVQLVGEKCGTIIKKSALYETAAWGLNEQADFLNMVAQITTPLMPLDLLHQILDIEISLGRKRNTKWGARTIDIDILFYNDEIINNSELIIPHPFLHLRRFTLIPLAEIAPDYMHPLLHKTSSQLLADCPDPLEVRLKGAIGI